jgi:ATP-binding cassette subfamily C (CFTR/MRP) protein 1
MICVVYAVHSLTFLFLRCASVSEHALAAGDISWIIDASLSATCAVALIPLSRLEHRRTVTPSDISVLYVSASLMLDLMRFSLPMVIPHDRSIRQYMPIGLAVKALLLGIEAHGKDTILLEAYQGLPPEQRSGVLGKLFLWWINPLLVEGYGGTFREHRLPDIDRDLASRPLRESMSKQWEPSE